MQREPASPDRDAAAPGAGVDPSRTAAPRTPNMIWTIGRGTLRVFASVLALPFVRMPKPPPDAPP